MINDVTAIRANTVLVIDDEHQIRHAIAQALRPLSDRVLEAATGAEGIALAASAHPDLIVLDLGLPDMSGATVCREIRRSSSSPIVVLSARHGEGDKVELLTAGADDYVTKPFGLAEFVARIGAQLRRSRVSGALAIRPMVHDGLTIDLVRREASRDAPIALTRIEWSLLETLVKHAGRTLTHQQLFDAVWAKSMGNPQQYLRVHMTNLRRKIEREPASPTLIVTDPGVGYRFESSSE